MNIKIAAVSVYKVTLSFQKHYSAFRQTEKIKFKEISVFFSKKVRILL